MIGYFAERMKGKKSSFVWMGLMCMTHPIMAELFYFDMMIDRVAWDYVICTLSVLLTYWGLLKRRWMALIGAVWLMIWTFSTYQVFVAFYIALAIMGYILLYRGQMERPTGQRASFVSLPFQIFIVFFVTFLINQWITSQWFSSSSYLDQKITWGKRSAENVLTQVVQHIAVGFFNKDKASIFHTCAYGLFALGALGCATAEAVMKANQTKRIEKLLFGAAVLMLQLTLFLMTIVLGSAPPVRAQIVYPLVLAFDIFYCMDFLKTHRCKVLHVFVCVLAFYVAFGQLQTTERLIYTDDVRSEWDTARLHQIMRDLQEISPEEKPIAVIGLAHAPLNAECIGFSVMEWDTWVKPTYMYSTERFCRSAAELGYAYAPVTEPEKKVEARAIADTMASYPQENSIVDAGEYFIVKLNER